MILTWIAGPCKHDPALFCECRGGYHPPAVGSFTVQPALRSKPAYIPPQAAHPQSEAILEQRFLSSPILSFARKRKNGEKKKRVLSVGFLSSQEDADAALGPVSFLCLARKILDRKNRFRVSEGFFGSVSAHGRSLRSL